MKTIAGIVAEFNPFHEGHRYLIEQVKKTLHPDLLVVIVSGPFSSRGLPCMQTQTVRTQKALEAGADLVIGLPSVFAMQSADYFAKYAIQSLKTAGVNLLWTVRTQKALEAGADLVIGLPSVFAMQSADYFAKYAIQSLKTAGVNLLCFGSESNDLTALEEQLEALESMEKDPSLSLARNAQKNGVAPRPNDILALQYLKNAKALDIQVRPFQRNDSFESATSIRKNYFASSNPESFPDFEPRQNWESYYPLLRYALLETPPARLASFFLVSEGIENRMIKAARTATTWEEFWESYYPLLRYALLETPPARLASFFLVSEGIENRMIKAARTATTWEEFFESAVSKTYSRARIQRTAMMILMQIERAEVEAHSSFFEIQVLGFNQKVESAVSKTYSRARIQRTAMMILMQIERAEVEAHSSFFEIQVLGFNQKGQQHLASLPEDTPIYSRIRQVPEPLRSWLIQSETLYSFFSPDSAGWRVQRFNT